MWLDSKAVNCPQKRGNSTDTGKVCLGGFFSRKAKRLSTNSYCGSKCSPRKLIQVCHLRLRPGASAPVGWSFSGGQVQPDQRFGGQIARMEFRKFLRQIVQLPCQILKQSRRLVYRLLGINEWTEAFLLGVDWLRRVRFG